MNTEIIFELFSSIEEAKKVYKKEFSYAFDILANSKDMYKHHKLGIMRIVQNTGRYKMCYVESFSIIDTIFSIQLCTISLSDITGPNKGWFERNFEKIKMQALKYGCLYIKGLFHSTSTIKEFYKMKWCDPHQSGYAGKGIIPLFNEELLNTLILKLTIINYRECPIKCKNKN